MRVVVAAVPGDGKHDMPEPEVEFCPPTPSSMGVRPTYIWKCRVRSISSSVSDTGAGPGSGSRQPERTGARAADSAIGTHGRFRNAAGRRHGAKASGGRGRSGAGPKRNHAEDR